MLTRLPEGATPEELFNLWSMCGAVAKVKIFFKNKESALVEFADRAAAERAHATLQSLPFRGRVVASAFSSAGPVSVEHLTEYTKRFDHSALNRFKETNQIYSRTISRPSPVLHLSNLHPALDQSALERLLCSASAKPHAVPVAVRDFKWLREEGNARMALVRLDSVSEAVEVIARFHNHSIQGKMMKISFGKNNL